MTHYYNAPVVFKGQVYKFHRMLGLLTYSKIRGKQPNTENISVEGDKKDYMDAVANPFFMKQRQKSEKWKQTRHRKQARLWACLLTWLCAHCYPLAYLCSHLRMSLFDNAGEASQFYYSVYPSFKRQRVLCLPRAIFIATTSRRFKEHGVMFIGSFLPTVRMHAWVVEDGSNADVYDNQWICFQPVMMMV